jgi:hypothetical protein
MARYRALRQIGLGAAEGYPSGHFLFIGQTFCSDLASKQPGDLVLPTLHARPNPWMDPLDASAAANLLAASLATDKKDQVIHPVVWVTTVGGPKPRPSGGDSIK